MEGVVCDCSLFCKLGMNRFLLLLSLSPFFSTVLNAQSLELMPGTERIFVDAQWLKTFDEEMKWSLFSRSRATVDYEGKTDLFMGAYLNYTTPSGFGGTLVGRISSSGAGTDAGVHFFRGGKTFMIYALASIALQSELNYAWFSIMRFTPALGKKLKLYTSLELFSNFNQQGHLASVQRIRVGADRKGYQWGLALNLSGLGATYSTVDTNPGVFFRKQF